MARGLLIIKTLTPTHPGAGTSLGAIDMMLQREVTTDFPFVQGSSLKGAMRSHLYSSLPNHEKSILDVVFGPRDTGGADFSKGALNLTDASLLFYPVRTLKGLYALVTCPEILRRLKMPHIGLKIHKDFLKLEEKGKVIPLDAELNNFTIGDRVYFEDLNFAIERKEADTSWTNDLHIDEKDKTRLFLVHDDVFQYFVEFATQVMSRNKIDYDTGTVDKKIGGIWTEENLPPETYLFSYLEDDGKLVDGSQTAFEWLATKFNSSDVIHLGGDETVGKGFVELRFKGLQEG